MPVQWIALLLFIRKLVVIEWITNAIYKLI